MDDFPDTQFDSKNDPYLLEALTLDSLCCAMLHNDDFIADSKFVVSGVVLSRGVLDTEDPPGLVDSCNAADILLWMSGLLLFSSIDMSDRLIVERDTARCFIA